MKEELIKYVMGKADKCYSNDFPIRSIEDWINEFFDQYQPERSKREDLDFHCLVNEFIDLRLTKEICSTREQEKYFHKGLIHFAEYLNSRCGALNTMET